MNFHEIFVKLAELSSEVGKIDWGFYLKLRDNVVIEYHNEKYCGNLNLELYHNEIILENEKKIIFIPNDNWEDIHFKVYD